MTGVLVTYLDSNAAGVGFAMLLYSLAIKIKSNAMALFAG
jgi:hypothetical protein